MINFERITENKLNIAVDIVNSNPFYNELENGNPLRSIQELTNELLKSGTESYFIKENEIYIGMLDFLPNNPNDQYPWIGLLMIHRDFQTGGYGKRAYFSFEKVLIDRSVKSVRLAVLQDNVLAKNFWMSLGFHFYKSSTWEGKIVNCFEKHFKE